MIITAHGPICTVSAAEGLTEAAYAHKNPSAAISSWRSASGTVPAGKVQVSLQVNK